MVVEKDWCGVKRGKKKRKKITWNKEQREREVLGEEQKEWE